MLWAAFEPLAYAVQRAQSVPVDRLDEHGVVQGTCVGLWGEEDGAALLADCHHDYVTVVV